MSLTVNNPFVNSGGGSGDIPNASTTQAGKVKLSNDTNLDSENLAATPKAVKDAIDIAKSYVDNKFKDSYLSKDYYIIPATNDGQVEILIPDVNYNPSHYAELLFRNTDKVIESDYNIIRVDINDPTKGYMITLTNPVTDFENTTFNLVLIKGIKDSSSGTGDVTWNDF